MDTTRIWTYDDLARLPDDGKRYEILDGDLVVSPSPTRAHQLTVGRLFLLLRQRLYEAGIAHVFVAPFDAILSLQRVVVPDLMVVRREREEIVHERGVEGPPDLAVEVMSTRSSIDRGRKFRLYAKAGVTEYWLVDPIGRTIEVYVLDDGAYHLIGFYGGSEVVHSATLDVAFTIDEAFEDVW